MKRRDEKVIRTIEQLVEAFGGTFAMAEWADVVPSSVSNWKSANYLPPGYHLRVWLWAQANGVRIDPSLLGLRDDDVPPRPSRQASACAA